VADLRMMVAAMLVQQCLCSPNDNAGVHDWAAWYGLAPCCISRYPSLPGAGSNQLQAEEEPDARLQSLLAAIEEEEAATSPVGAAATANSSDPCSAFPRYKLLPKVRYQPASSAPGGSKTATATDRLARHKNLSGSSPSSLPVARRLASVCTHLHLAALHMANIHLLGIQQHAGSCRTPRNMLVVWGWRGGSAASPGAQF